MVQLKSQVEVNVYLPFFEADLFALLLTCTDSQYWKMMMYVTILMGPRSVKSTLSI